MMGFNIVLLQTSCSSIRLLTTENINVLLLWLLAVLLENEFKRKQELSHTYVCVPWQREEGEQLVWYLYSLFFIYNILSLMFIVKNLVKPSKAAYIFDRKCIVLQVMKWSTRRRSSYPSHKIHASLQGMERVYSI